MNYKPDMGSGPLFLGFDLSTQQLKGLVVDTQLAHKYEAIVDFDADLSQKYHVEKGTITNPAEGEVYAPVAMWLAAVDLVLSRFKEQGLDFSRLKGISGAGMQHGSVFWSFQGEHDLETLDVAKPLEDQLSDAFAWPYSPNWQDASTEVECNAFDREFSTGSASSSACIDVDASRIELATRTGSKAHHRFTGPQIMRLRKKRPEAYEKTARVSLVSSWLASIFLGRIAPIDLSDVCGMNLWDIPGNCYNARLMALASGGDAKGLERKLHRPSSVEGVLGPISQYFVKRWGFSAECQIAPSTGDNPSTILSLPLQAHDAIVSLGTSTTFLMSTPTYLPDPSYHFFNHPATKGLYMFMLCYKNGGLAREKVRDALNEGMGAMSKSWEAFDKAAIEGSILGTSDQTQPAQVGLYFPKPEIVPSVSAGTWRFSYDPKTKELKRKAEGASAGGKQASDLVRTDARGIIESQFLSLRLRSRNLVSSPSSSADGSKLPPQPRRIFLVGGGSVNQAIARIAGEVLGGSEGVYRLDVGGNACALGAAYRAAWACQSQKGESFEDFIRQRWDEDKFVAKVNDGYVKGVFERYELGVEALAAAEEAVLQETSG